MSHLGKRWKIDGLISGLISRNAIGGNYRVAFEREFASLEQIEAINWSRPTVEYIGPHGSEPGLPEGYGFDVVKITYDSNCKTYYVELKTAKQYLGDVTGYQDEIKALNNAAAEKDALIRDQNKKIIDLQDQLAEADELAIALYEAQTAAEAAPAESDAEEVTGE